MKDQPQEIPTGRETITHDFNGLQAGRAFAALVVLLFHANAVLALPKYIGKDLYPILHAGSSGVHFFFVLSGFIIFYIHRCELGQPKYVGSFIRKRVSRLIPALWATLALVLTSYLVWPSLNTNPNLTVLDVASAFLLLPAAREPLLIVEWTLRHEVLFYALFALIIASKRVGGSILALWMALSILIPLVQPNFPTSFVFSEYHALFGMGVVVAICFERRWIRFPRTTLLGGTLAFSIIWILRASEKEGGILINLAFGLAAAAIIAGLTEIERFGPIRLSKALTFLGNASYSIYLIHFLAVSAASKFVIVLLRFVTLPDTLCFFFVTGFALLAGTCFHVWIERPLTSGAKVLLGRGKTKVRPDMPAPSATRSLR
ncbi:hypothetical protein XI04_26390 [Bradyrhizobium sp. CCBAU 11430]|uniref:acyltransferase family protein n=1 Tax=Bradyrhizobium sp. CCBAU 11430 TaxID=1630881 RepID=UPI002306D506|nr:acyltransferase [Bradyrhizobium sp. CCBAU 11430]MDA9516559.1 hypothetical protein [Bradyrhizobium sp. CCBAU 11430]